MQAASTAQAAVQGRRPRSPPLPWKPSAACGSGAARCEGSWSPLRRLRMHVNGLWNRERINMGSNQRPRPRWGRHRQGPHRHQQRRWQPHGVHCCSQSSLRPAERAPVALAPLEAQRAAWRSIDEIMHSAAAGESPNRSVALSDATLSVSPPRAAVAEGGSTAESQPPATANPSTTFVTPRPAAGPSSETCLPALDYPSTPDLGR